MRRNSQSHSRHMCCCPRCHLVTPCKGCPLRWCPQLSGFLGCSVQARGRKAPSPLCSCLRHPLAAPLHLPPCRSPPLHHHTTYEPLGSQVMMSRTASWHLPQNLHTLQEVPKEGTLSLTTCVALPPALDLPAARPWRCSGGACTPPRVASPAPWPTVADGAVALPAAALLRLPGPATRAARGAAVGAPAPPPRRAAAAAPTAAARWPAAHRHTEPTSGHHVTPHDTF